MCKFQAIDCPGVPGPPPNGRERLGDGVHIVEYCKEYSVENYNVYSYSNSHKLEPPIERLCDLCASSRPSRNKGSKFDNHYHPYKKARKLK